MSDQPKTYDDGFLGKAKRMADRVGDYARSDEAKMKLDAVKKKAAEAGKAASIGAKKLAEGTKQAAVQAREKAEEFSKSEQVQAMKAKVREDWDEIRGGDIRCSRLSESPVLVGLAILFLWPLGLFMLWKAPILRHSPKWWIAGATWALLITTVLYESKGGKPASTVSLERIEPTHDPSSTSSSASGPRPLPEMDEGDRMEIYRSIRRRAQTCWLRCCIEGDVHGIGGTKYQYALKSYKEWMPKYRKDASEGNHIPESLLLSIYAEGKRKNWYGSEEGWATPFPEMPGEPMPIYRYAPGEL